MLRKRFVFLLILIAGYGILPAQLELDRVLYISHTEGKNTYYLSFEDGGGGEMLTKKMEKPGKDETFFLEHIARDSSGNNLYLISSLEGYRMRTDADKQLIADEKESSPGCFFRVEGRDTLRILDVEGWILRFDPMERAFLMSEVSPLAGENIEADLEKGLALYGSDVPGGIEGIGLLKTFSDFDKLYEQFPELLKGYKPLNPLGPMGPVKPTIPFQFDPKEIKPTDMQLDQLKKEMPAQIKINKGNKRP